MKINQKRKNKELVTSLLGQFMSNKSEPGTSRFINDLKNEVASDTLLHSYCLGFTEITKTIMPILNSMEMMEEIIMQLRAIDTLLVVKLFVFGDYIYARAPFFRRNRRSKELRVIICKTESNVNTFSADLYKKGLIEMKSRMREIVMRNIRSFKFEDVLRSADWGIDVIQK